MVIRAMVLVSLLKILRCKTQVVYLSLVSLVIISQCTHAFQSNPACLTRNHHHDDVSMNKYKTCNLIKRTPSRRCNNFINFMKLVEDEGEGDDEEKLYIRFSRAFQRHVVFKCKVNDNSCSHYDCTYGEVIKSYQFLDDAISSFPSAHIVKLRDIIDTDDFLTMSGLGITPSTEMVEKTSMPSSQAVQKSFSYLKSLSLNGQRQPVTNFISTVLPQRIAAFTPENIHRNYDRVMDLLTRGRNRSNIPEMANNNDLFRITKVGLAFDEADARTVIAEFPQLCLYDIHELEDRIKFFISPLPNQWEIEQDSDYYRMMRRGYGAGMSIDQATKAVKAVPQFLSIHYEDSRKPSMIYFYNILKIPPMSLNEARAELSAQYLLGCDASDICAFAYLHSLGIKWRQIRLLLEALPTLTYAEKDPSWDILDSKMRSELDINMVHYLRKRLQVTNDDVHSMLKIHSRLSSYHIQNIKMTLDALQNLLHLSSCELRSLTLRMPSIIGMCVNNTNGTSSLEKKIHFFLDEVHLDSNQLKQCIVNHPSLLQYSLVSLKAKMTFLMDELAVPEEYLSRVISMSPGILKLSLEENLIPTTATLKMLCGFSTEQLGEVITTCPSILTLSIKRKIEPCLSFLATNLCISSPQELGKMILSSPRILLQGVETSLARKLRMIEDALQEEIHGIENTTLIQSEVRKVIKSNPALLVTTNTILKKRLENLKSDSGKSITTEFRKRKVGRKRKFSSQLANSTSIVDKKNTLMSHQAIGGISLEENIPNNTIVISAYVAGSIFPPDNITQPRGKRKAGGIAIMLTTNNFDFDFELARQKSFGLTMPEEDYGSNQGKGNKIVLVGFPFLRPSRNRCNLYACHGALKVILQLMKQLRENKSIDTTKSTRVIITICTESSYAWNLLKNITQVQQWSSITSPEDFNGHTVTTHRQPWSANPDLLIPLAKTVDRIISSNETIGSSSSGSINFTGNDDCISVRFIHSAEVGKSYNYINMVNNLSIKAARWQFNKA